MRSVIEGFVPQGGKHCITNSLKQIFSYYGYPMSEELMFGIASGLSFLYINQAHAPMINGRTKVFEFERKLAQRLSITISCKSAKDYTKVFERSKQLIDAKHPVLVYVDMPYLPYLHMNQNSHFGGHAVVLFGYDEAAQVFLVSDRDQHDHPIPIPNGVVQKDDHEVPFHDLELARSSRHRPFPANNQYLMFDFHGYHEVNQAMVYEAIKETCDTMLRPPAQLLGINGIRKCSKEVLKWAHFDIQKRKLAGVTNYFQISKDGGTGGGIFRNMYGGFLNEAASICNHQPLAALGQRFIDLGHKWDGVADIFRQLSLHGEVELLVKLSSDILALYEEEKQLYMALETEVEHASS